MAAALRGRLLGRFELSVDGRPVERSAFERPSGARLLKLLLATPGHRIRREAAAELLWPEMDPERSAASLRKAVHFARRALGDGASEHDSPIAGDAEWLWIGARDTLDLDLERLRGALDAVRDAGRAKDGREWAALETVAELGGAELLPEDPYEEWLVPIRERLRQQTIEAFQRGAASARDDGRRELAFRLVDGALALTVWIAAEVEHAHGNYAGAMALRRRELELLAALGGNEHNQAMAHAHISNLAGKLGDATLGEGEARVARLIAQHSGLPHLPPRIEKALASPGWFIEDVPKRQP